MGISKISFLLPERAFADWMASHELNERISVEYMREIRGYDMVSYLQQAIKGADANAGNCSADLKSKVEANPSSEGQNQHIEKLKRGLAELQVMVNDLFRCKSVFGKEKQLLSQAVFSLNHALQPLILVPNAAVISIVQDLAKVIELLRMGKFSEGVESKLTLANFKDKLVEFENLATNLTKSYGDPHLNDLFYDTQETENFSLTSEVEYVVKLPELQDKPKGKHPWKSQFEKSLEPTGDYLINDWLVVSSVSPNHQNIQPPPSVPFTDGEVIKLEILAEKNKLPPDHLLREEIIKSIKTWNKLQIKKKQMVMLTCLVGAIVFGSAGIRGPRQNAPTSAFILQRILLVSGVLFGYFSMIAGVAIYNLYELRERVSEIKDLGGWVKQVRAYVRKYPILAHRYSTIQKFFTQKELAWAKKCDR